MTADLVVRGGLVADGTGAPAFRADIGIENGKVTAIGDHVDGRADLDASGCVVAPGFIDIHTHYDAQVFWDTALTPSSHHGVTTVIAGNCGFSIAPTRAEHRELVARTLENVEDMNPATLAAGIPWSFETFPDYLDAVRRRGPVLNFGAYIGHTALRLFIMGDAAYEREATHAEIQTMAATVTEAMDAGAIGFATSFAITHRGVDGLPVPSRFATRDEFLALAAAVGQGRAGVVSVAPGDPIGLDELYEIQPDIGVPFTYGALLTTPSGSHLKARQRNRDGWDAGVEVWPQVTPRPLAFQMSVAEPFTLNVNPEFATLMAGSDTQRREAYADPEWRRRALDGFEAQRGLRPRWDTYVIDESPTHPELVGRRLSELADERGETPLDSWCAVALDDDLETRVRAILANDDTEAVAELLQEPHCTLGLSDAGAHVGQLCDAPQATELLGTWVRERSVLSVEEAVRKLSGVQADLFGLSGRGYLRDGAWADIVVFDPDTVAPGPTRRVRDFPGDAERLTADRPEGIRHVVVNGTLIRRDGEALDTAVEDHPGQMVRPAPRRTAG